MLYLPLRNKRPLRNEASACRRWFAIAVWTALVTSGVASRADVIVVDTELDDSSDAELCDLRDAIEASNDDVPVDGCPAGSSTGVDVIEFAEGITSILLTSSLPLVDGPVHIVGPGVDRLTIDGDDSHQIFYVFLGGLDNEFVLSGMTLFQGWTAFNGGCLELAGDAPALISDVRVDSCQASRSGGGIALAQADVTLERLTVINNRAASGGGLLFVSSEVDLRDSSILHNRIENAVEENDGWGGGLLIAGGNEVLIHQSTFWGNEAPKGGAALSLFSTSSTLDLSNSTLTENDAGADGLGGALHVNGPVVALYSTIVADNGHDPEDQPQPDVVLGTAGSIVSSGLNFIGSNAGAETSFPEGFPNASFDWVGTEVSPLTAALEALADHGGPTWTAPPTPASLVVDRGSCVGTSADQRGWGSPGGLGRPVDGNPPVFVADDCDVGAVELGAQPPVLFADGFESGDVEAWQ